MTRLAFSADGKPCKLAAHHSCPVLCSFRCRLSRACSRAEHLCGLQAYSSVVLSLFQSRCQAAGGACTLPVGLNLGAESSS